MTNLKCHVTNCAHNEQALCNLNNIDVSGCHADCKDDTCCHSFQSRSDAVTNGLSNSVGGSGCACEETAVCCSAENCMHNDHNRCAAQCICVEGNGACDCEQTECGSFRCK